MTAKAIRPAPGLPREYVDAFRDIVGRIEDAIKSSAGAQALPIKMYVAGGAAQFFYTGARVSLDIDATLSKRILLPDDLEVAYIDADGAARVLYYDLQYNETFALIHEDVHDDSKPLALPGIDPGIIDVRLFSPTDLAVSKLSRFAEHDQDDIAALARAGLIDADTVRARAEDALAGYIGDIPRVKTSIKLACELIERSRPRLSRKK